MLLSLPQAILDRIAASVCSDFSPSSWKALRLTCKAARQAVDQELEQVGGRLQEFPGSGTSLLSRLCSLKGLCLHLQRNITPTQFDTAIREVLQAVSTGCQGHGGRLEQLQLTCLSSRAGRLSTYWSAESLRALGGVAPNLQHLQLDLSTALGVGHTGAATSLLAHLPPGLKSLDLSAYPSQVSSNQGWSTWVPATSLQTLKLTLLEEGGFNVPPMDCHPLSAGSFQSLTLIDPVGAVISPSTICSSLPIALQKLSLQLLHGTGGLSAASLSQLTQLQVLSLFEMDAAWAEAALHVPSLRRLNIFGLLTGGPGSWTELATRASGSGSVTHCFIKCLQSHQTTSAFLLLFPLTCLEINTAAPHNAFLNSAALGRIAQPSVAATLRSLSVVVPCSMDEIGGLLCGWSRGFQRLQRLQLLCSTMAGEVRHAPLQRSPPDYNPANVLENAARAAGVECTGRALAKFGMGWLTDEQLEVALVRGFPQLEYLELSGWCLLTHGGLARVMRRRPGLQVAYAGRMVSFS